MTPPFFLLSLSKIPCSPPPLFFSFHSMAYSARPLPFTAAASHPGAPSWRPFLFPATPPHQLLCSLPLLYFIPVFVLLPLPDVTCPRLLPSCYQPLVRHWTTVAAIMDHQLLVIPLHLLDFEDWLSGKVKRKIPLIWLLLFYQLILWIIIVSGVKNY